MHRLSLQFLKISLQIANCREEPRGDRFASDCILRQAVGSLAASSGLQKYVRMTHLLDRMRSAKGSRISYFARSRRQATREASLVAAWAIG
jgi:hypothetical protein